jgi:hypothetical protein
MRKGSGGRTPKTRARLQGALPRPAPKHGPPSPTDDHRATRSPGATITPTGDSMAAIWLFQNVGGPAHHVADCASVEPTRIEARDHEETGTRIYEAFDSSGAAPRSIGLYRTLADARAACQRHRDQVGAPMRGEASHVEPHGELRRLLARESAKA